jgi:hypothetical protein
MEGKGLRFLESKYPEFRVMYQRYGGQGSHMLLWPEAKDSRVATALGGNDITLWIKFKELWSLLKKWGVQMPDSPDIVDFHHTFFQLSDGAGISSSALKRPPLPLTRSIVDPPLSDASVRATVRSCERGHGHGGGAVTPIAPAGPSRVVKE